MWIGRYVVFFFFFKQKTAYEITRCLEFRRVLFRSRIDELLLHVTLLFHSSHERPTVARLIASAFRPSSSSSAAIGPDRKSTRLNSSHLVISYAVFCLKKKKSTI